MDPKNHPAITVSNIKNFIPITLEMETSQYASWAELFKIHCRAFQVLEHLSPRQVDPPAAAAKDADKEKSSDSDKQKSSAKDDDIWNRLDAIVLQWIYGTISHDLLSTIIRPDSTASYAWTALKSIFHDNQTTRAVLLQKKFANTKLDSFPSMTAYCQEVKMLSDQLANVGSPVNEQTLVIQLLSGLNEAYGSAATIIQNKDPFPTFYEARSQLILEETTKANRVANDTAFHTSHQPPNSNTNTSTQPTFNRNGNRGRGRHRGRGRGRTSTSTFPSQYPHSQQPPTYYPPFGAHSQQPTAQTHSPSYWTQPNNNYWPAPPCPYPTTLPSRPNNPNPSQGILGPRPQQAYTATEPAHIPTELGQAFNSFTLNPPDQNWYMDTGATGSPHAGAPPSM
ncbi:putative RNA-directed DNA polymerase [Helianthus annuus]|uniref:Putative retrotransposon gag protein n=1 Tax=Helianthus annuus TaxID=4232 RepID=A0A251V5F9_HELAN|nr:uncharacterized protein LOC110928582 [Helianthus annuus]KAF5812635.1 putative RNA-directed DNA polymerase [Helianthus annuus]KAJ0492469.1 putative RNA-directed DNA polymerase [Helianthus annuus]KAJ0933763.1 putative RNA-directed DNA polymerase [Helianthus annuus]